MSRALGFKLRAAHIQQQSIMGLLLKAGLKQNIPHPAPKMKEQQKNQTHTNPHRHGNAQGYLEVHGWL